MRYAELKDGVCINVVIADSTAADLFGFVELPDGYGVGDYYNGKWRHKKPATDAEKMRADIDFIMLMGGYDK